jgi:hypothetical protein
MGRPGAGRTPPMGTPGCTGGAVGRAGALYTGRGPVCGTIMRGAGVGGAAGLAAMGAGGALAELGDTAGIDEAGSGGGGIGRTGGVPAGDDDAEAVTAGLVGTAGDAGFETGWGGRTIFGPGGVVVGATTTGAGTGLSAGGAVAGAWVLAGAAAREATGGADASLRCVIAFRTSPGREMRDRSILVLISSSPRIDREVDLFPAEEPSPAERR